MSRQFIKQIVRAGLFGALAGSRSMLPIALLTRDIASHGGDGHGAAAEANAQAKSVPVQLLAVGELIADKLPGTPDRTALPSVFFRGLMGAVAATMFYGSKREGREYAAAAGLLGAIGSTYALFQLRKLISSRTVVPDSLTATGEDAAATKAGLLLLATRAA